MKTTTFFTKTLFLVLFLFTYTNLIAQTKSQIEKIRQKSNLIELSNLEIKFKEKERREKEKALRMAALKNWPLIIEKNGTYAELQKVTPDGKPVYYTTFNVNAAKSTRANYLNSGGGLGLNLDGQNMTAYIWDGGLARSTHQEYDGPGGNNRFSIGDGTTTLHYHSAHVTGTIIASGVRANAKGMAPQAKAIGYEWNNDTSEATTAASNGMLISNHSYGYGASQIPDQWFGAYGSDAHDWDEIMYNAPYYLMVVAAGNDGDDNSSNGAPLDGNSYYDKLSGHATAKNNMVVANGQDASIDSNGNLTSVTINSSSSEGPTDDYRIKPDITGNGTAVYSTSDNSDTAYETLTGTSMASPNVAGTLLLLQQHYNNKNGSFMRAATLKGLALHTADDAGISGPDAIYGWGLLNAKAAAEAISNDGNGSLIKELTLSPGQSYTTTVTADGINDLIASISWTDPAGTVNSATNSSTPALVNDLDIRVTKNGTTYYPYKLTSITTNSRGDNTVDPYERVDVSNASGTYTITVTHKGTLSNSQNYSLIVTGLTSNVSCTATTPTGLNVSNISDNSAQVSWNSVSGTTYDVRYKTLSGTTWTTISASGTSTTLNGLTAETQYEVQVRSKCLDGSTSNYSTSVSFTTAAVQLNYCSSKGNSVSDEYIQRVQLNTINNSSDGGNGYSNFTSISTDLTVGQSYTITITPKWTGTIYNEGYAVWIDYNHDGDFEDSGELVWSKAASKDTPVSGTFTVSSSASQTATRMRVSMKYNGIPTACETFSYGEVEDYTVNLTAGSSDTQAPSAPANLTASNVTQTTVDLNWNASTDNVGVTGYDVYKDGTYLGNVTGTSAQVTGLTEGTSYSFYVKAKDAAGNVSAASNTVNVTTQSVSTGSNCSSTVNSYPYHEGFENTLGAWQQSTSDDFDWTVKSGSTPSSGTGPSSAAEGSYYVYMESSSPNYSNKKAILESPCFDFNGVSSPAVEFKYHMYGDTSKMGYLKLEVSADNGTTWTNVWTKSGNQGDSWYTASVDLSSYAGTVIKMRFFGETGTTWKGDMAVDDFTVKNNTCVATTLTLTFDNYPEETSWEIKDNNGTVVYSGGTYGSEPDGSTKVINMCIDTGCYTFTMKDAYGDGMCCSYGNGSYSFNKDSDGTVLASGGSFKSSESTNFCLNTTNGFTVSANAQHENLPDINIYPNPVKDIMMVYIKDQNMRTYKILNMIGQIVAKGSLSTETINLTHLNAGVYFIQFNSDKKTITRKFVKE